MFSGGVESTAVLTTLDPKRDHVLTVNDSSRFTSYVDNDEVATRKIARHYGFEIPIYFNFEHTASPTMQHCVKPVFTLLPAASIVCSKMREITEIVWGEHKHDIFSGATWPQYVEAFNIMHPKIKVHMPLAHLTKQEQWEMIDDKVKPYVISCYDHHPQVVDGCEMCEDRKLINGRYTSTT